MSKLLQRLLQAFERKSVDTVLRTFTAAADDLRKLETKLAAQAETHFAAAKDSLASADAAKGEAERAKTIAQRIEALISG
jgi:hypothetical protein